MVADTGGDGKPGLLFMAKSRDRMERQGQLECPLGVKKDEHLKVSPENLTHYLDAFRLSPVRRMTSYRWLLYVRRSPGGKGDNLSGTTKCHGADTKDDMVVTELEVISGMV